MMLRSLLLCSALLAGCYSEEPDVVYGGSVGVGAAPGLVAISPGVEVIADYDYPVFYSDGLYWRYDGGSWYQSTYWGGGWGVAYNVPYGVRGISNPGAYTHWRGGNGSYVRDHRGSAGSDYRGGAGYDRRGHRATPAARGFGGGGAIRGGGSRGGGGGFHGGGGHGGHR